MGMLVPYPYPYPTYFEHTRHIPIFAQIFIPIPAINEAGSGRVFRVLVGLLSLLESYLFSSEDHLKLEKL